MEQPTNEGQIASTGQPTSGAESVCKKPSILLVCALFGVVILLFGYFIFSTSAGSGIFIVLLPCFLLALFVIFYSYQSNKSKQLQMKLDKTTYSPGEEITGSVIINLDKEKQARSLKARFYGLQQHGKHSYRVCETEAILSSAHTFRKGESFRIALLVPNDAMQYSKDATHYLVRASGYEDARATDWYVEVQLDIPNEVDVLKHEEVKLRVAPGQPPVPAVQTQT